MFANFFQLLSRRGSSDYEDSFVQGVNLRPAPVRSPRMIRLLWWMWGLIALKSIFVWWACGRFPVPFHPLWVVGPTVLFGLLVNTVYLARH